jgi:hypothetical protein
LGGCLEPNGRGEGVMDMLEKVEILVPSVYTFKAA